MEVNFKAKHIATTKNIYKNFSTRIDIYELSKRDKPFLEKLKKQVNFSEMMPDLCEYSRKRWQKVFDYGIENAKTSDYTSFLAFNNNKPCGILTYLKNGSSIILDCICDIPISKGKRANYIGSTLFCQLFKRSEELKAKSVELSAITDGEFDVISKYKAKGFKETGMQDGYVKMSCNKFRIKEQLSELLSKISYKSIDNSKEINLDDLII